MHMDRIRDLLAERGMDVSNIKTADQALTKIQETLAEKNSEIDRRSKKLTTLKIVANGKRPKQTRPELPLQCRTALDRLKSFAYDLEYRDPDSDENVALIDKGTQAIIKRDGLDYGAALVKLTEEKPSLFRELGLQTSPQEIFGDLVTTYTERFKGDLGIRIERFAEDNDPDVALGLATGEYAEDSAGAEKYMTVMHPSLAELAQIAECDWDGFVNACNGAWVKDVEGEAFAQRVVDRYNRARQAEEREAQRLQEQDGIYKTYLAERGI